MTKNYEKIHQDVRKMLEYTERVLDPIIGDDLFALNDEQTLAQIKTGIENFAVNCQKNSGVARYNVGEPAWDTWEDYYPFMPLRLLAMEAVETIGNYLAVTPENTQKVQGYPYELFISYRVQFEDGWETFNDIEDFAECESIKSIETIKEYVIKDPTGKMTVPLYIIPTQPVKLITLNTVITPTEVNFYE